jgi:outer membrane protein assembly factor BamB
MQGSIGRSRRARLALGAAVVALAAAPAAWADWATWGNGSMRQGVATESLLTSKNAKTLRLAWSRPIGGTGAAQPLAISGQAVPGGRIYVAAAESGTVSAFVAQTGQLLWKRELGSLLTGCTQLPKGRFGITGTPTYDTTTGVLYVAALNYLYALDVRTGLDAPGWPIELGMDPHYEVIWGAVAQRGTSVYVATASYCDRRPYAGRVIRVDTTPPAHRAETWYSVEDVVPGGGGIWGWGGVAITPDGHVWAATANANAKTLNDDAHWNAESVVELSDHLGLLQVGHAKGMPIHGDYGFGSTPVVFTPKRCAPLVAAEGKDGVLYVWQRAALGKGPTQRIQLGFPGTLYGLPAWDSRTQKLYLTTSTGYRGIQSGLQVLKVNVPSCRVKLEYTRPLDHALDSVPTIANDVAVIGTGKGHVAIERTKDGKRIKTLKASGSVFAQPTVIGADVAVTDWKGRLTVFRLKPPPPTS